MEYIATILISYLIGTANAAYAIAAYKKVDILAAGSKNPGASNAAITMGWAAGAVVAIFDIGKAVAAVYLCSALFPGVPVIGVLAGVSAVLGHIFPFYKKFRGGKGFASYLGMVFGISWKAFLVILGLVIILTLITDYIVVGTTMTVISFPLYLIIFNGGWLLAAVACAASAVIVYKHIPNYKRIISGQEIGLRSVGR